VDVVFHKAWMLSHHTVLPYLCIHSYIHGSCTHAHTLLFRYAMIVIVTADCAAEFFRVTDEDDVCRDVASEILISLTGDDVDREVEHTAIYESNLFQAILSGRLQEILVDLFPGSAISILSGTGGPPAPTPTPNDPDDDGLSAGATAGITMAVLLLALVPIAVFFVRRQRVPPEHKHDYEPYEADGENDMDDVLPPASSVSVYTDDALGETATLGVAATLGASQADYGKSSRSAFEAMEAGEDLVAEPGMDVAPDSSSNAGSSGWSSSAGISSLNTGSMDESTDMAAAAGIGMGLAAIGATSALSRKIDSDKRGYVLYLHRDIHVCLWSLACVV
jgi:hypothetical protein